MVVGRELDALVAEKVMGWVIPPKGEWSIELTHTARGTLSRYGHPWSPSTDMGAAWGLVEKCNLDLLKVDDGWMVGYFDGFTNDEGIVDGRMERFAIADTAPLAICLAALNAVGVEV